MTAVVTIDGRDIRDVTLASLRAQIGIVTQETVLFDDTIAGNTPTACRTATPAQIEAAARAANAHDFIVQQPDGYNTMIGERGQRLSGGQRQRLAIARALLKNSPLILDEATSALDAEAERLVQQALATLMMNRTSFVIAHRLRRCGAPTRSSCSSAAGSSRSASTTSWWRGRTGPTRAFTSCNCSNPRPTRASSRPCPPHRRRKARDDRA